MHKVILLLIISLCSFIPAIIGVNQEQIKTENMK